MEKETAKYITYPKFVFLCGKALDGSEYDTSNRGIVDNFITRLSNDTFIVLSEKLWEDNFNSNIDLLTFEEFLAEISDCIVLFVESPGSFCELGTFSYANKLFGDKLVVVVDERFKNKKSFIMTGPVLKAKKDGAEVVFASLEGNGLLSSKNLRNTLQMRIEHFDSKSINLNKRLINKDESKVYINSFIIELLELIKIAQPITQEDLLELYKTVKAFTAFSFVKRDGSKFNTEIKISYIIKLLETVKLINVKDNVITTIHYKKAQGFMLKYYGNAESKERNRLICRKYRYMGIVE